MASAETPEQVIQRIAALLDATGIVRMQDLELDMDYIERWVDELGLAVQWAAAKMKIR